MKRLTLYLVGIIITATLLITGCDNNSIVKDNAPPTDSQITLQRGAEKDGKVAQNRYIVMFKEQPSGIARAQVAQQAVVQTNTIFSSLSIPQDSLIHQYKWASSGFAAHLTLSQVKQLRSSPLVDHVVKDFYYKAINYIPSFVLPHLNNEMINSGQTTPWGVNRVKGPLNGSGKKAWIIDTGIDLDHPDLNVDGMSSVSFVANESANDQNGHGTHVAGIVAAKDNSLEVVGVAADANVVAVKVCNQYGGCFVSDVKAGVEYAAANFTSGDVANISLGYPEDCFTDDIPPAFDNCDIALSIMENSIINAASAGLKFTISAGNDSDDANNYSPARINHTNVYTLSAFDNTDTFASFSNYGNPPIKFSEPGVDILSLWKNGGTNTLSGTSMAAPHLAGLLLAAPLGITTDGAVSNDADGDPDPISVAKIIPPPLTVQFVSGPTTVQTGQLVAYTASATGGTSPYNFHFTWSYINQPLQPAMNAPNTNAVSNPYQFVVPNQTGQIRLKVHATDANGATGDDQLRIFVFGIGGPSSGE